MSQQQPILRQPFTVEEKSVYGSLFKNVDNEGLGVVTGEIARPIFEKSGLSTTDLREIWQLADTEGNGFLTEFAFFASLRLIGHCQHGAHPSLELLHLSGPIADLNPGASRHTPQVSRQSSIQANPGPLFPPLTPQDVSKFGQLFQRTAPGGILNGDQAKSIFMKANLPTPTLGQIWNLVDRQQAGRLTQQEFVIAMYLIQNTINGSIKQIPQFIPNPIWDIAGSGSAAATTSTQSPRSQLAVPARVPSVQRQSSHSSIGSSASVTKDWIISSTQKQQYESIFDNLDKNKLGVLTPNEIASFLMTSNLPQDTLGAIWDLADVENSGEFTKREFNIALYLVNRKIAGGDLPNIVPDSLINSALPLASSVPGGVPEQPHLAQASAPQRTQSSMNDLASLNDLFSSPVVTPTMARTPTDPVKPQLTSSLTGSRAPFVPSSSFGQHIVSEQLKEQKPEPPSLLEESGEESDDDEGPISAEPIRGHQRPTIPAREQKPHFTGDSATTPTAPSSNYDALRGFSSQPAQGFTSQPAQSRQPTGQFTQPAPAPVSQPPVHGNDDLLANSEVSGQLSQATTDIANVSNQINSLTNQTTQLNDKRERATAELNKILLLKKDIEGKLTKLRVLYDQEVKQVEEVELVLLQSKQETEGLRKETSLTEANYHATQAKLQQLQVQYEESQKETETLKERLGVLNAENIELNKQHEQMIAQQKQSTSMLSVTQQQVNVLESKNNTLRLELESTNKEVSGVEEEHETAKSKLESLKAEIPMLTAAISAAAATVAMTKSLLKGTNSTIEYHSQQKKELEEKHLKLKLQGTNEDASPMYSAESAPEGKRSLEGVEEPTSNEEDQTEEAGLSDKLHDFSVGSPASNTQAESSVRTTTETPVSSPAGSDFQYAQQYQNFNLPLARPHSTSSSVLNNPPLSVRGEEDVSEPASPSSIEEETATPTGTIKNQLHPHEEQTSQDYVDQSTNELEKEVQATSQSSSTGESFELVEAENDDAHTIQRKDTNEQLADNSLFNVVDELPSSSNLTIKPSSSDELESQEDKQLQTEEPQLTSLPGAFVVPQEQTETEADVGEVPTSHADEEFPPIKELDYDESDSSEEEDDKFHDTDNVPTEKSPIESSKEHFDDALDSLPPAAGGLDEFDDLQPLVEEEEGKNADDIFDDFGGLEEALPEDHQQVSAFEDDANNAFQQGFTDSTAHNDAFDSFDNLEPTTNETNNDEWEQLFEGFGNNKPSAYPQTAPEAPVREASSTQVFPVIGSNQDSQAHELAVQELTGMGFDQLAVIEALNKENWNLENATNHLLDNA